MAVESRLSVDAVVDVRRRLLASGVRPTHKEVGRFFGLHAGSVAAWMKGGRGKK